MGKLKNKISTFLKKVWNAIEKAWDKLDDKVKIIVPIAIDVTNAIKQIVREDSGSGLFLDMVVARTKFDLDDHALQLVRKLVPEVLTKLIIVKNISDIEDPELQLKAIIDELRLFNKDQQEIFFDGFSKKFVEYAIDGEITRAEIGYLTSWCYLNSK